MSDLPWTDDDCTNLGMAVLDALIQAKDEGCYAVIVQPTNDGWVIDGVRRKVKEARP